MKVDFIGGCDINGKYEKRYRVYYNPISYYNFAEKPRIIGENTGMGVEDISSVVEELKEFN